jgi:hypothetical protein
LYKQAWPLDHKRRTIAGASRAAPDTMGYLRWRF